MSYEPHAVEVFAWVMKNYPNDPQPRGPEDWLWQEAMTAIRREVAADRSPINRMIDKATGRKP